MADTGGVRNSWGKGLPSSRQYDSEDEIRRYEAPVFVPQAPSMVARRNSLSAANLAETLKQRNMLPVPNFSKGSKVRDRISVSFRTYALNLSFLYQFQDFWANVNVESMPSSVSIYLACRLWAFKHAYCV